MKKILLLLIFFNAVNFANAEVTYLEIMNNPTDLKLNLQYAKEQEDQGEIKNVIATLERLTALYPKNIDLKIYLLSISVKTDSTEKIIRLMNEIRQSKEIDDQTKKKVAQIFNDLSKKKSDPEKNKARDEAKKVVKKEEKKREEATKEKSKWTFYQDFGWKAALHSNISNVSNTKTKYSVGSVVTMTGTEGDDVATINSLIGAIYQIDDKSNLSLSVGTSSSEQNRDTSDENDTNTFSSNYSKFTEKNVFTVSYSFTDTNSRRTADSFSNNLSFNNIYSYKENQKILTGLNFGNSRGNQNTANATKRESNTWRQGYSLGYEYLFGAQHKINLNYSYTDTHAVANYNAFDNDTISVTYTKDFTFGNLGLTYSYSDKLYDEADSFVNSNIIRSDKVDNYTVSLNGNLGQVFRSQEKIKIPKKIENFLNTLSYSMSWSETNNEGSLLQHNYNKESFNFRLTKRIYY